MKNTETGASLSETALIILFVCLFSVGSISSLRDRSEATLWLVTLYLMSPETYLSDGRTRVDVWAPASAFRI